MCSARTRVERQQHAEQGLGPESTELALNEIGSDVQWCLGAGSTKLWL